MPERFATLRFEGPAHTYPHNYVVQIRNSRPETILPESFGANGRAISGGLYQGGRVFSEAFTKWLLLCLLVGWAVSTTVFLQ